MQRIVTANGLFQEGNPATNTKGTIVTADWLNGVQEEIMAVIEAAGLQPSNENLSQLLQAIKSLAPGTGESGDQWPPGGSGGGGGFMSKPGPMMDWSNQIVNVDYFDEFSLSMVPGQVYSIIFCHCIPGASPSAGISATNFPPLGYYRTMISPVVDLAPAMIGKMFEQIMYDFGTDYNGDAVLGNVLRYKSPGRIFVRTYQWTQEDSDGKPTDGQWNDWSLIGGGHAPRLVGTRTTNGTWTLNDLMPGVPLSLFYYGAGNYAQIQVVDGVSHMGTQQDNPQTILLGDDGGGNYWPLNATIMPSTDTVTLDIYISSENDENQLTARQ